MDETTIDEARVVLAQLKERLTRDVGDMRRVLEADIPKHVLRSVRGVFERTERADALDDAAIKRLKQDAEALSVRLTAEVLGMLEPFEAWGWEPAWAFPEAPTGLDDHPRLAEALARIPAELGALLERHALPVRELFEQGRYRLPAYFVAGQFMKSLVANYWRALRDYHALRERLGEADQAEQRHARRTRWDEV